MSEEIDSISLKDVCELLRREVESPTLLPADPDIYQKIALSLGSLKGQGFEGIEAKVRDRIVELMSSAARLLVEVRQRKAQSISERLDYSLLTDEEKYVLDGKSESQSRMAEVVAAASRGRPKVLETISARVREKRIIVRFIKPMEQFIGVDMTKYGPFQQEDVATLPLENARSLMEAGVVVQVHVQLGSVNS
jgi:DNA replication factor GINS